MRKVLFFILLICPVVLQGQDKEVYAMFHKKMEHLSLEQILESADRYARAEAFDTAIIIYTVGMNRFSNDMPLKEKELCSVYHLRVGNIYYAQGSYINAMDVFIKGLEISESCDSNKNTIKFLCDIGNIYFLFQDLEKAVTYYRRAYELCSKCDYPEAEIKLLNNLTSTYCYIPDNEKAAHYYRLMKEKNIKDGPLFEIYNFHTLLAGGILLSNYKRYKEAIKSIKQSVVFSQERKMGPWFECVSYEDLYKAYGKLGRQDSMMHYLHLFYSTAKENGFTDKLIEALKVLPAVYEEKKDMDNARLYKGEYLALADSIFNFREFSKIKNLQFVYETEKYNKEMNNLQALQVVKEKEIRIQRKILAGVLMGMVVISMLLIIVYRQKKKLGRSYKDLFQVNNEIVNSVLYSRKRRVLQQQKFREKNPFIEEMQNNGEVIPSTGRETRVIQACDMRSSANNLNEEQKNNLLDAINLVMDETQEYCEIDFSLNKLAALVKSNTKYVSLVINETYQKNFNSFVNEYRIREARLRLTDVEQYGNYTIQAISESVGYKSSTTFINVFRKITGITPSMYQRMAKGQKNLQIQEFAK